MLKTTVRRLIAAAAVAAAVLAIAIASSAQGQPKRVLYHHFCPLTKSAVAAAGPYEAR
jgi:hypothetical protein